MGRSMPRSPEPQVGDRLPLIGFSVALLAAVVGVLFARASSRGEFAEALSTYRSESDGARGLFLVAERVGLPVERRHLDLENIDGTPELVLLGVEGDLPSVDEAIDAGAGLDVWWRERLGEYESKEILRAVESGATLVYAVGRSHPLLSELGVTFTALEDATPRTLEPLSPTPFSRGVQSVHTRVAGYLDAAGALPLLIDANAGGDSVALLLSRGAGRVVVLSAPMLASNQALLEDDNATWLINTLRELRAAGGNISFDEHHHGFTSDRSVMSYASRFGLGWMVLQAVFALALWSASRRRLGPPEPIVEERGYAAADYLLAMSRIYQRGRHQGHAAQLLVGGVTRRLQAMLHLPRPTSGSELQAGLVARHKDELAREWAELQGRRRDDLKEFELLQLAQAATRLRQRLHAQPIPHDPPERPS